MLRVFVMQEERLWFTKASRDLLIFIRAARQTPTMHMIYACVHNPCFWQTLVQTCAMTLATRACNTVPLRVDCRNSPGAEQRQKPCKPHATHSGLHATHLELSNDNTHTCLLNGGSSLHRLDQDLQGLLLVVLGLGAEGVLGFIALHCKKAESVISVDKNTASF